MVTPVPVPAGELPADADSISLGAVDLGDITALPKTKYLTYTIDGDAVDYFRLTISEPKLLIVGIRQLDADASITLERKDGTVVTTKSRTSADHVMIHRVMLEGTYYLRVDAAASVFNEYQLAHGVGKHGPTPAIVAKLREEQNRSETATL